MPQIAIRAKATAETAGTLSCTSESTYQIEPRSAPRSAFLVQKTSQPSQAVAMIGTFTTSQVTAAPSHILTIGTYLSARTQSMVIAISTRIG